MSLYGENLEKACESYRRLNERVNILFKKLDLPLKDKIQMAHYGELYLFGKRVSEMTTDCKLKKIISKTQKEDYDKYDIRFGSHYFPPEENEQHRDLLDKLIECYLTIRKKIRRLWLCYF
jgi:hypothetical protein